MTIAAESLRQYVQQKAMDELLLSRVISLDLCRRDKLVRRAERVVFRGKELAVCDCPPTAISTPLHL